ncbi:unnamed protein product [Rhizopus stolonifer]
MGHSTSTLLPQKSLEDKTDVQKIPLNNMRILQPQWDVAQDNLLLDVVEVRKALDLFLNSQISQAESILQPKRSSSLYHSLGYAFIMFLKSVMTFQQTDIEMAIESLKETIQLANGFRKKDSSWVGSITAWVKGITVQDIKNMSLLHRHAELIFAESYLLKALLCIVHDESFASFFREGLNVRSSYNTYKVMEKFIIESEDSSDPEIDNHFTSGVLLGVGLFHIMISLLPSSVMKLVEFIGFTSDRTHGLKTLEKVGKWEGDSSLIEPLPPQGLRRQFCDMTLLLYHVVLSKLIPLTDENGKLAERILDYNLKIYPSGIFFLYFSGKHLGAKGNITGAKIQFENAIQTQKDWKQLQHLCYWELGLINLLQQNWQSCIKLYHTLYRESNWSKSVYSYLWAISCYMDALTKDSGSEEYKKLVQKANETIQKVTHSKQKIAGKSIPLEKFMSRKARKFIMQNNTLVLPDLEIMATFNAFELMNKEILLKTLDRLNNEIYRLTNAVEHQEALNFYDDFCLCHYIRIIVLRLLVAGPERDKSMHDWNNLRQQSIQAVLKNSDKIQLDHYIYYFTRYEEARMEIAQKHYKLAQEIIQSIIKSSEKGQFNVGAGPHAKNKYSLESALLFKCHNCLAEIELLISL